MVEVIISATFAGRCCWKIRNVDWSHDPRTFEFLCQNLWSTPRRSQSDTRTVCKRSNTLKFIFLKDWQNVGIDLIDPRRSGSTLVQDTWMSLVGEKFDDYALRDSCDHRTIIVCSRTMHRNAFLWEIWGRFEELRNDTELLCMQRRGIYRGRRNSQSEGGEYGLALEICLSSQTFVWLSSSGVQNDREAKVSSQSTSACREGDHYDWLFSHQFVCFYQWKVQLRLSDRHDSSRDEGGRLKTLIAYCEFRRSDLSWLFNHKRSSEMFCGFRAYSINRRLDIRPLSK
jgi:hypothetical protein